MATAFGTSATFGLVTETGIITDSIGYSYSQESKVVRNGTGDVTGKTYYDERAEVTISGFIPTSSPFSGTMAATISLVTAIPDHFKGSVNAQTIIESVTRTTSNEDYQRIEVTAMNHVAMA